MKWSGNMQVPAQRLPRAIALVNVKHQRHKSGTVYHLSVYTCTLEIERHLRSLLLKLPRIARSGTSALGPIAKRNAAL
eukprot:scaffold4680_cov164-Skeletonema_marinoi.AAC.18